MSRTLTISLAQINPTVGDVSGNVDRILAARSQAQAAGADLVVYPELTLSGYPPEDLVLKQAFQDRIVSAVDQLAAVTADGGPALLVGAPWQVGTLLHNAVLLLDRGTVTAIRLKHHLPNYGVFDEARVFVPGPLPVPLGFRGVKLGVMVCEDMWYGDVAAALAQAGAEILVIANGSPFERDKQGSRLAHARSRVLETELPLIYVNQVGGQDELVFDGASFVLDNSGSETVRLHSWRDHVETTVWTHHDGHGWVTAGPMAPILSPQETLYQALMIGLRDYVAKNHFPGVVLGLSGGIDSALAAALAADALGPDRVWGVMMPSPYTSPDSLEDAALVAQMLGCRLDTIDIAPAMATFQQMLAPFFAGRPADITEENLQSRARGLTVMALSNKFGPMVLSTGNKSEMSTGYATLYGDMCGGYAVLKDVYKMTIFDLCRWRNRHCPAGALGPQGAVMPERVITKPPSAELKPDQKDQDSLPPYEDLDAILECLIEGELSVADTVARGWNEDVVRRVWRMLDRSEYKRRQAAPGVKITSRSFGRDRRYPITNGFTAIL